MRTDPAAEGGIRLYRAEDRAACLRAFASNVPQFFAAEEREDFEAFLDAVEAGRHPGYRVVVDAAGRVVGCGGHAIDGSGTVADLCWAMVDREQQRAGHGRRLLEARLAAIRALGAVRRVRLSTSQHAAGFYQRAGFVIVRIVPGGFAPDIDRCELELRLDDDEPA